MSSDLSYSYRQRGQGSVTNEPYVFPYANERGITLVQQEQLPYAESTIRGNRWKVRIATPIAAIVAAPSTLANLEVVNNRPNYVLVVDTIFSWQLLGTAVVWAHTPWAAVGAKVYAANTALVVYSSNAGASYASAADSIIQTAITQTVVESGWEVFPSSSLNFGLAAATPGGANVGQVDGRLVVPYNKSLYVAVTGSVNTASAFIVGASGHWAAATNVT